VCRAGHQGAFFGGFVTQVQGKQVFLQIAGLVDAAQPTTGVVGIVDLLVKVPAGF
jgi:hypothetical protein